MLKRKKVNRIQINGRHYDATTGELLAGGQAEPRAIPLVHSAPQHHAQSQPVHHVKRAASRPPVNHTHSHSPKPSKTLMRRAVQKPSGHRTHRLRAQGRTGVPASLAFVPPKASVFGLDELRVRHAKHIKRSQLIKHFSAAAVYPVPATVRTIPTPSRPPAANHPTNHSRKHSLVHHKKTRTTADVLEQALEQASSFRELPVK